jgi:3',5'-cyclic-nucleotide phosphodiesterase
MHHIHESIPIISRADIDLFGAFKPPQTGRVWSLFTNLILATDMSRHFDVVKRSQTTLDAGTFSVEDPELRLLDLQVLMKVADISNVSRPFALADKWCDILNEEFFHQGDLEQAAGIPFTSPLNDREHANKPKSQIGFYNFICIPLYTILARLHTPLQVMLDAVKANFEKWNVLAAAV